MSIDALHDDIPFLFIMAPSILISEKKIKIWPPENTFEEALPFFMYLTMQRSKLSIWKEP